MKDKTQIDIFGIAALDYLKGEKDAILKVNVNVAEEDTLPVSYFFRTYRKMPHLERIALANCRGKVLDVGAGTGVHALYLQRKGFEVNAIDSSPGMVEAMEKRGVKMASCSDFFDFETQGFDSILLLMNGIGLAGTLNGLQPLLIHAKSLLNPGGMILVESTNILYVYEQEDGSYRIPLNSNYFGETTISLTYKNLKSNPMKWLYVDPDTLALAADKTGFGMEIMYQGKSNNYLICLTLK
jgi:SAM-dependent methyltransferase